MIKALLWIAGGVVGCLSYIVMTIFADVVYCRFATPRWWGRTLPLAIPAALVVLYLFLTIGPIWWAVRMGGKKAMAVWESFAE